MELDSPRRGRRLVAFRIVLLLLCVCGAAPVATGQGVAVERRLAEELGLRVGDTVMLGPAPDSLRMAGVVAAVYEPRPDPSGIMRRDRQVRLHLPDLARLLGHPDRVDRFGIRLREGVAAETAAAQLDRTAFGYRARPSAAIASESSQTFLVVSRFHRAIAVITIVASAVFLLCIMLLKVDERRRDVAALRLIGCSTRTIVGSVVLEAAAVAVLGSVAGVGVGVAASWIVNQHYQGVYRTPLRFSIVTGDIVLLAVALSLVLGIVAGWLAARRLVRTPPLALFGR